jgi:hypothetical protein
MNVRLSGKKLEHFSKEIFRQRVEYKLRDLMPLYLHEIAFDNSYFSRELCHVRRSSGLIMHLH